MTLVFTDIHFGLKLNSEIFLDIAQNNIKWIEEQVKKYKVDKIIFCGDFFHQRNSVSVNTLNRAYESLKSLASKVDEFYMIVGNHDSYYKNSSSVHSLKTFEQFSNIKVIETSTEIKLGKNTVLLVPWGGDFQGEKKYNMMFGHFEPNGAKVSGGQIFECAHYSLEDLNLVSPLVFSGHFHSKNEYITKNGVVIFAGTPSQQNWGDCNEPRGAYILDETTNQYKFIENKEAPKFIKFFYSNLLDNKLPIKKSQISGNFIKIIVDCQYKFSKVQELVSKFNTADPLSVETEYYYSNQIGNVINGSGDAVSTIKTHEDYIKEFILNPDNEFPESIDRERLLKEALDVFRIVQTKEDDEELVPEVEEIAA